MIFFQIRVEIRHSQNACEKWCHFFTFFPETFSLLHADSSLGYNTAWMERNVLQNGLAMLKSRKKIPLMSLTLITLGLMIGMIGCADNQPSGASAVASTQSRSVLDDPIGYKPSFEDSNISGGGLFHYDKKAMEKDLKHVFDP